MRAADALLAGSQHRKLELEDEAAGARLRPFFKAAGWVADRLAVMRCAGPGRPHADVEEAELLETHPLRVEWYLHYDDDPAVQQALAAAQDRVSVRRGMRAFVVRDDGGEPVGFATLAVGEATRSRSTSSTSRRTRAPAGSVGGWWRRRWPPAGAKWHGSWPTTKGARGRCTSGSGSRPSGACTPSCGNHEPPR